MANLDIESAISSFKDNAARYAKTTDYYNGKHDLAKYATENFKKEFLRMFEDFRINYCPAVCDSVSDNLQIAGFNVEKSAKADIPTAAWELWQNNRMSVRAGQVHKEVAKNGDAYAIVWVDAQGKLTIYPNKAATCAVMYDEETPGKILWAAKHWLDREKKVRLNLFYADRIEKYISKKKSENGAMPAGGEFVAFNAEGSEVVANPYGTVPVFHFSNNSDIGSPGQSELVQAIPIQDALNKAALDLIVHMEFTSYRQRYATGIEPDYDDDGKEIPPFTSGSNKLWITDNPDATFGDFETTDLSQFLKVKESLRDDLAGVTGTPHYYLMTTKGDFPSGEALKKSETRFTKKIKDRQESFGQVWAELMAFALRIEKKGQDVRLFTKWEDPSPLSEKENLENILLKTQIGISDEQALSEAGYGEEDISRMLKEKEAKQETFVKTFNAGDETGAEI